MNITAAEARAEGVFLRGPAALLAKRGGAGRQVDRAADEAVAISRNANNRLQRTALARRR
jgi:hypothetical protein